MGVVVAVSLSDTFFLISVVHNSQSVELLCQIDHAFNTNGRVALSIQIRTK
jgi:hypothetical protein